MNGREENRHALTDIELMPDEIDISVVFAEETCGGQGMCLSELLFRLSGCAATAIIEEGACEGQCAVRREEALAM